MRGESEANKGNTRSTPHRKMIDLVGKWILLKNGARHLRLSGIIITLQLSRVLRKQTPCSDVKSAWAVTHWGNPNSTKTCVRDFLLWYVQSTRKEPDWQPNVSKKKSARFAVSWDKSISRIRRQTRQTKTQNLNTFCLPNWRLLLTQFVLFWTEITSKPKACREICRVWKESEALNMEEIIGSWSGFVAVAGLQRSQRHGVFSNQWHRSGSVRPAPRETRAWSWKGFGIVRLISDRWNMQASKQSSACVCVCVCVFSLCVWCVCMRVSFSFENDSLDQRSVHRPSGERYWFEDPLTNHAGVQHKQHKCGQFLCTATPMQQHPTHHTYPLVRAGMSRKSDCFTYCSSLCAIPEIHRTWHKVLCWKEMYRYKNFMKHQLRNWVQFCSGSRQETWPHWKVWPRVHRYEYIFRSALQSEDLRRMKWHHDRANEMKNPPNPRHSRAKTAVYMGSGKKRTTQEQLQQNLSVTLQVDHV